MPGFFFPRRTTSLIALASALEVGNFKMQGSVLATFVNENLNIGNYNPDSPYQDTVVVTPNKQEFTHAFFISYKPIRDRDLNFRAFYKKIFRMPTFNDLYCSMETFANTICLRTFRFGFSVINLFNG